MSQILFLCSANYYRSRFAEHFFNWLAESSGLSCRADSRGLMVGYWGNIGAISPHTLDALQQRGVPIHGDNRDPEQLTEDDLRRADLVIAVKEAEHRPAMVELFPHWADAIEYWHVDDLDCAGPEEALAELECHVRTLLMRLSSGECAA